MLAAMRVLEKQVGGIILDKMIGTERKNSSVWDVSPMDLELINQRVALCQLSVIPETQVNPRELSSQVKVASQLTTREEPITAVNMGLDSKGS